MKTRWAVLCVITVWAIFCSILVWIILLSWDVEQILAHISVGCLSLKVFVAVVPPMWQPIVIMNIHCPWDIGQVGLVK